LKVTILLTTNGLSEETKAFMHDKTALSILPSMPSKDGEFLTLFDNTKGLPILILKVNELFTYKNVNYIRKAFLPYKGKISITFVNKEEVSEDIFKNVVLGLKLWEYDFSSLKSEKKALNKVDFDQTIDKKSEKEITAIASAMKTTMQIVDLPPNLKNPDYLADYISTMGKKTKLDVEVLSKKELIDKGFGALISVGMASDYGTYLAIISYKGNKKNKIDYAFIGKGVTFDTGGISLKASTNMHYMKSDLGGAAAVIGAMQLIADQKPSSNITAVIPIVENVISAKATRPGDVITAYSGKTIEVIDTDAEGRLILADALSYTVSKVKPEKIIDLATLTGSSVMTFGSQYAAMFTKNKETAASLCNLGEMTGDKVWPMPMDDDYAELMQSDIADIKNFHGRPYAGAITAAKFLEYFTENHNDWVHLDIAGVAYVDSDLVKSKIASGFGVRLLAELAKK
jgi:leucyl aminopeptidase